MKAKCPYCGVARDSADGQRGHRIHCGTCTELFVATGLPEPEKEVGDAASGVAAPSTGEPQPPEDRLVAEYREAGAFHRLNFSFMVGESTVYLAASGTLLHMLLLVLSSTAGERHSSTNF